MRERKLEVLRQELSDVRSFDIVGLLKFDHAEDLFIQCQCSDPERSDPRLTTYVDRSETGSMSGGHILVKSIDRFGSGHLPILLVHIVGTRSRVIS